jgi:hypothetical protein
MSGSNTRAVSVMIPERMAITSSMVIPALFGW